MPVIEFERYLQVGFFRDRLASLGERIDEQLVQEFHRLQSTFAGEAFPDPVSPRALMRFFDSASPDDVRSTLGIQTPNDLSRLSALLHLRESKTKALSEQVNEQWAACVELAFGIGHAKSRERAGASLAKDLANHARQLPGDVMYLNEIVAGESWGFCAMLRPLQQVDEMEVALRPSQMKRASFYRAGRLRSPFVYSLTQRLAAVFSAIGLPAEYGTAAWIGDI